MEHARIIPAPTPTQHDDITTLALEIMDSEGRPLHEALVMAGADLDILTAYGESWDRAAFLAGNDDAMPF